MTMLLAAASAACAAACLACLVALHVLPTGYSPVRNAVSEYGVGRFALLYRVQAALLGAAGIFLALALRNGIAAVSAQVLVELVAFGLARVAIGWYPTDLIGSTRRTRTGAIHVLLAVIAFSMITLAALRLGRELGHVAGWSTAADVVRGLALAMAVTALGTGIAVRTTPLRPWTGLIERGFYAAVLAFFFVVTIKLATS